MNDADTEWKSAAVGRFQNADTIRTDSFGFTEYTDSKGRLISRMLYDYSDAPNENVNVSGSRQTLSLKLANELHEEMGWDKK